MGMVLCFRGRSGYPRLHDEQLVSTPRRAEELGKLAAMVSNRPSKPRRATSGKRTNESVRVDPENPPWTAETFARALSGARRTRIIAGKLQAGDVTALRRFVALTPAQFAEAFGISLRMLQSWERDRVIPRGAARVLLRIAARHPHVVRELVSAAKC
jgi:DNA-binding transcriptional regulator YiaG